MSHGHSQIRVEGKFGSHFHYCIGCQRVSLRFGNIQIPLTLERLDEFIPFLEETCSRHFAREQERELRFRYSDVYLCFEREEAEALLDVARLGHTEVCRHRLEHLFGSQSKV